MIEKHIFLSPDYYEKFICKMGKCRKPCCEGWPVTFSVEDYFKLMGCECSEAMQRRLDIGIKLSLSPTPDAYAQIQPKYDGSCPMHLEDGKCAIHAELGESLLSDVCRLYPRGIRNEPSFECSMANSCEGVLELFFHRNEKIRFVKSEKTIYMPIFGKRAVTYQTFGLEQEIRLYLISLIQNREKPFLKRFEDMATAFLSLEKLIDEKDEQGIKKLISSTPVDNKHIFEIGKEHLLFAINAIKNILEILDKKSESLRKYGEETILFFNENENLEEKYNTAKKDFENNFPDWEIFFEHMIVNHMFFEQFPFQDRPVSLWDEFLSICTLYSMLRFLCIGYTATHKSKNDFIDTCTAVFRLVEHTSFDTYAAKALKHLNCNSPQKLFDIVSL